MKKITLCGSTKFKREFEAINKQLTLEGNLVYSVAFFAHYDKIDLTHEQKILVDKVHFAKIDNSDGIFVIDVDGYIGHSTRNEINHAESTGKFVKYLSDFPDLIRMCDTITFRTALESLGEEEVKETKSCNHEIDFGQTACKHCGEIYIHQPY